MSPLSRSDGWPSHLYSAHTISMVNTLESETSNDAAVTVVGDIHGSLAALAHILETNGSALLPGIA